MIDYLDALKARGIDAHQADTDSIAATLTTMAQHLDGLTPQLQGVFSKMIMQMNTQLETLRAKRYSPYEYFTGKGPVARKLREFALMMEIYHPVNTPRTRDFLAQLDWVFDKNPTKDEAEIAELARFIKMTLPLMTGQTLDGQRFEKIPADTVLSKLKSGFYEVEGVTLSRHVMVLNTCIERVNDNTIEQSILVTYILEAGREEQLLFRHVEENEWLKADYSYTFVGLVNMLRFELDTIIEAMGLSACQLDLEKELASIAQKADYIFDQHVRLPKRGVDILEHDRDSSEITIKVSPQCFWKFIDTRGKWPSRSYKFFRQLASDIVQSADPSGFNEFSRQYMIKLLNRELDRVIAALAPVTEDEAA